MRRALARHTTLTIASALLLTIGVSAARAGRLSSSSQTIRATFPSIEFNGEELVIIRCVTTLEGSFHTRTIAKVERALVGAVTKAVANQERCTNGRGSTFNGVERYNGTTSPNTLPWHMTYEGFTGTLPNITSVNILLSRFRYGLQDSAGLCAGQYGTASDNFTIIAARSARGGITSLTPRNGSNTTTLFRRDAGIFCPNGRLTGPGTGTVLGATTLITITLI